MWNVRTFFPPFNSDWLKFVAQHFKTKREDLFQVSLQAQLIAKQVVVLKFFGSKYEWRRLFYNENPVVPTYLVYIIHKTLH